MFSHNRTPKRQPGRSLPRSPPIPPAGQGGKGPREVRVSYLEFRGAPFISNQQQVTLTIHYDLLLKSATLGREQSSRSSEGGGKQRETPNEGQGRLQSSAALADEVQRQGSPLELGRGVRTQTTPQAPWKPDLTLGRLLLHVGAGQVAVHEG